MTTEHIDSWFAGESIAGVRFRLNDAVRVSSGQHAGMVGSVISLLAVQPEPRYIVETSSGRDVEILDHELQINAA
jgi:hypothetical protein